jgi:hypothetical protein
MMNDPIPAARAVEIIDAYGADSARWPGAEREAVLAAIARDAGLRARLGEAASLDADLADWANAPVETAMPFDAGRVVAPARQGWRWAGAGLAAIAAALGVVLVVPSRAPAPVVVATTAQTTADTAASHATDGFSYVFTPTAEEEDSLI